MCNRCVSNRAQIIAGIFPLCASRVHLLMNTSKFKDLILEKYLYESRAYEVSTERGPDDGLATKTSTGAGFKVVVCISCAIEHMKPCLHVPTVSMSGCIARIRDQFINEKTTLSRIFFLPARHQVFRCLHSLHNNCSRLFRARRTILGGLTRWTFFLPSS